VPELSSVVFRFRPRLTASTTDDDDCSLSTTSDIDVQRGIFFRKVPCSSALKLFLLITGAFASETKLLLSICSSRRNPRMEVGEARDSSPNSDLSDAPTSDMEATPIAGNSAQPLAANTGSNGPAHSVGSGQHGVANHANAGASHAPATSTSTPRQGTTPQVLPTKRKPRVKKESLPVDADKLKEKPKRKPRSDKGTTKPPNKKPKLEPAPETNRVCTPILSQTSITNTIKFQPQPPSTNNPPHPQIEARPTSQNGLTRMQNVYDSPKPTYNPPANDSPTTSSNMYDPVRAMTVQRPSSSTNTPQTMYQSNYNVPSQPQSPFRPGASPAISSIMNHPEPWRTGPPIQYRPDGQSQITEPASMPTPQQPPLPSTAMNIDGARSARQSPKPDASSENSLATKETSPAPEKKQRAKEQPPPLPQGSGLLSSTLFGGGASDTATSSDKIPSIILNIDLKAKNNNIVNFARLAEEKYGFAALHPRLAAQKERLARVAAVGAALERSASGSRMGGTSAGESGDDDGSVDIDRDSGDDGDALMGGMNNTDGAGNSGTDGPIKRRRRKKIEEYDQEDPFVDDSELVWESQAAASKDGFFVYCGPLVPEGEKPAVERYAFHLGSIPENYANNVNRADGTVKRGRGRGRGGGVGSRGGRGASRLNGTETGSGRATGPGSRGGNTTRKPRITKASREHMEREKAEREKMAPIAARPTGYPNPS
jgi:hypothetical protein